MGGVITLTTDFGYTDAYVAAMKGVILNINPDINVVDICHDIKPQNITQAAFVLHTAYPYFPKRTVHVVVVDPGVGADRQVIILRTPQADFVAPDNGVLSYVIRRYMPASKEKITKQESVLTEYLACAKMDQDTEVVAVTNEKFFRQPVSNTFHGRDILSPVAAALSMGFKPREFGEPLKNLKLLPLSKPETRSGNSVLGHVIHIDAFGNLVTDITAKELPQNKGRVLVFKISGRVISGLSQNYTHSSGLLALIGSSGHLELAMSNGSAGSVLAARIGDEVLVELA